MSIGRVYVIMKAAARWPDVPAEARGRVRVGAADREIPADTRTSQLAHQTRLPP